MIEGRKNKEPPRPPELSPSLSLSLSHMARRFRGLVQLVLQCFIGFRFYFQLLFRALAGASSSCHAAPSGHRSTSLQISTAAFSTPHHGAFPHVSN